MNKKMYEIRTAVLANTWLNIRAVYEILRFTTFAWFKVEIFRETLSKSVPSNISYKSFKTYRIFLSKIPTLILLKSLILL